ncbi:ankyrin repeat-containing domain protein [Podospora didyma]|uniref:Ankyrin repeat-containing domain protein n=1 Tax=Podospora didyma TaxID=330526 RepID=A0AAE0TW69_9PEZI|nr:ankyrin repeat-containing domain protein [Podospora didyma]
MSASEIDPGFPAACVSASLDQHQLLVMAVHGGSEDVLLMLLDTVEWDPVRLGNALTVAIDCGEHRLAKHLLNAGASPNESFKLKLSGLDYLITLPLVAAVKHDQHAPVKLLLDQGADVNQGAGALETALEVVAQKQDMDMLNILLEANADVNAPATLGRVTALQWAATQGNLEMADLRCFIFYSAIDRRFRGATGANIYGQSGLRSKIMCKEINEKERLDWEESHMEREGCREEWKKNYNGTDNDDEEDDEREYDEVLREIKEETSIREDEENCNESEGGIQEHDEAEGGVDAGDMQLSEYLELGSRELLPSVLFTEKPWYHPQQFALDVDHVVDNSLLEGGFQLPAEEHAMISWNEEMNLGGDHRTFGGNLLDHHHEDADGFWEDFMQDSDS